MPDFPSTPQQQYMVASYRYMRLAMVILVITLGVSIAVERAVATCWQGSISAYYYTPVHSLFVGALVAIGVTLVALKGKNGVEDMFFNIAGVLAPIVALVPTSRPSTLCSRPGDELTLHTTALVRNNVPALIVGTALAIVSAYVIARVRRTAGSPSLPRPSAIGLAIGAALLIAGVWWYNAATDNFEQYAHGAAAATMFLFIWFAVLVNAGWPAGALKLVYGVFGEDVPDTRPTPRERLFRNWYRGVAAAMAVGAIVVVATAPLGIDWEHKIFWLEALEIAPFAAFWTLQTFEAWNTGVAEPTSVAAA